MRGAVRRVGVALGAALLLTGAASACTGDGTAATHDPAAAGAAGAAPPQAGGTLRVLVPGTVATWDPQLMYPGAESFFAQRTFVRTLTTYGTGDRQRDLVGDLATGTGTTKDKGRTWSFTLRKGVAWQDGTPVTCEDIRHGVARTFDRTTHIAGTNYATFLLDIPTKVTSEGLEKPVYAGPGDKRNKPLLDKAVRCSGQTITFRLRLPELDFPHVVALPEFAPRKPAADTKKAAATWTVASTGPYRLEGAWVVGKGGTFVRNEKWVPASDPVRKALPDRIEVQAGLSDSTAMSRLLNQHGDDARAVSWVQASPTLRNQSGTDLTARLTFPWTGSVDYLAINMRSKVMRNPVVREAFDLATNRASYVTANGGEGAGEPTWSVLSPAVAPKATKPPKGAKSLGDPEAARKLLESAGLKLPVPVRVVHAESALADKAYAALEAGWERAGFEVTLTGVQPEEYYRTIEKASSYRDFDVFRGVWRPDYPSAGGVLPALFDARINVDSSGPGQDVGYFDDPKVRAAIDRALTTTDPDARAEQWLAVDQLVREAGGYVALAATKALHLHGAGVVHYEDHAVGGIVDLATVSVR